LTSPGVSETQKRGHGLKEVLKETLARMTDNINRYIAISKNS
jgi:hypothetical protein